MEEEKNELEKKRLEKCLDEIAKEYEEWLKSVRDSWWWLKF